ncbi:MAG: hypothetical protein WDM90_05205 [Ferruginibacter sp.]
MNMGLKNAQQIGGLAIDPKNENRLFVAALGHPYGANEERACTEQPMAEKHGKGFYIKMKIQEQFRLLSTPIIQHYLCRYVGSKARSLGKRCMERKRKRHF